MSSWDKNNIAKGAHGNVFGQEHIPHALTWDKSNTGKMALTPQSSNHGCCTRLTQLIAYVCVCASYNSSVSKRVRVRPNRLVLNNRTTITNHRAAQAGGLTYICIVSLPPAEQPYVPTIKCFK